MFGRRQASVPEITEKQWTSTDVAAYEGSGEKFRAAILEQYKIYVEMADRISARRSLHNTFFLTANTGIIAITTAFFQGLSKNGLLLLLPLAMLLTQCVAWFWILRSYRQLSSAKYRVIGALEQRLPASPYWLAEWAALGSGREKGLYWPITKLEQWTPVMFASSYVALFVTVAVRA